MKQNKHTPGPWTIHNGGSSEYYIKADNWVIAETCKSHATMSSTESANAHLIAAAPDMLEALEGAVERLRSAWAAIEHLRDHAPDTLKKLAEEEMDEIEQFGPTMDRAIAKARGES